MVLLFVGTRCVRNKYKTPSHRNNQRTCMYTFNDNANEIFYFDIKDNIYSNNSNVYIK